MLEATCDLHADTSHIELAGTLGPWDSTKSRAQGTARLKRIDRNGVEIDTVDGRLEMSFSVTFHGYIIEFGEPGGSRHEYWSVYRPVDGGPLYGQAGLGDIQLGGEPAGQYPDQVVIELPEYECTIWGSGVPTLRRAVVDADGNVTRDDRLLIPEEVTKAHGIIFQAGSPPAGGQWTHRPENLGRWLVIAVHGRHLSGMELDPGSGVATDDRYVQYKLLKKSKFGAGTEWGHFWRQFIQRQSEPFTKLSGMERKEFDVYIVAAKLAPNTPAGDYGFTVNGIPVSWTLANATNLADTRFVRPFRGEFRPVSNAYTYDELHVEVQPEWPVEDTDVLIVEVTDGAHEGNETSLPAFRVGGSNLFRTPVLRIAGREETSGYFYKNQRQGESPDDRCVLPVEVGSTLFARVAPHSEIRQAVIEPVSVHASPAALGVHWLAAVVKAAEIAEVPLDKPPVDLTIAQRRDLLASPWTTVGGVTWKHDVDLSVGDLAAMLLIREQFICRVTELKTGPMFREPPYPAGWTATPQTRETAYHLLRGPATAQHSPIGDIDVEPGVGTTPLRDLYAEEYLGDRVAHNKAADVLVQVVDATNRALANAQNPDILEDPEALLKLAGIGTEQLIDDICDDLLVLRGSSWEYDTESYFHLRAVAGYGDEFVANEEHSGVIMDIASCTLAAGGFAIQTTCRLVGTTRALAIGAVAVDAADLALTLADGFPAWMEHRAEVDLAIGAYGVLGVDRYINAKQRAKPGWVPFVSLAGSSLSLATNISPLRAVWNDEQILSLISKRPNEFAALSPADRERTVARYLQLKHLDETRWPCPRFINETLWKANTELVGIIGRQRKIIDRGDLLMERIGELPDVYLRHLQSSARLQTAIVRVGEASQDCASGQLLHDRVLLAGPREVLEVADDGAVTRRPTLLLTIGRDLTELELEEGASIGEIVLGRRLGNGLYFTAYEQQGTELAVKVIRDLGPEGSGLAGQGTLRRVLHGASLIDEDYQVSIRGSGRIGSISYIIQDDALKAGGRILKRVTGEIDGDLMGRRVVGVRLADGTCGPMEREDAHAILQLYKHYISKGAVCEDLHLSNIVLFNDAEKGVIAKALDTDRTWSWSESYLAEPMDSVADALYFIYDFSHPEIVRRLQSMVGHKPPTQAAAMLGTGEHFYPSAEFFMYKMLEYHGFINYVQGRGWVSGSMDLKHVLEIFPDIADARYIAPDLSRVGAPKAPPSVPDGPPLSILESRRTPALPCFLTAA